MSLPAPTRPLPHVRRRRHPLTASDPRATPRREAHIKVVIGQGGRDLPPDGSPVATLPTRARQVEALATRDYWVMVYDWVGTKVLDTVVRAKVFEYDDAGELHLDAVGSPENQWLAIEEMKAEDAEPLIAALSGPHHAQVAWKQVEEGSFELPPITWINHTNGLPNVGPFLVDRWDRGETPDTMRTWRNQVARPGLEIWVWGMAGAALAGLAAALWRYFT